MKVSSPSAIAPRHPTLSQSVHACRERRLHEPDRVDLSDSPRLKLFGVSMPLSGAKAAEDPPPPAEPPAGTYQNPLVEEFTADPAVLREGEVYYLYTTSGNEPAGFPIRASRDLVHWEPHGAIFPPGGRPGWTRSDLWAPSVHRLGDRYMAYYTARDETERLCIGAAWSDRPDGHFVDLGGPLIRNPAVGMIDPQLFVDEDGRSYLYWKGDHNDLRPQEPTPIYVQEVACDGITLLGEPTEVLHNDLEWEGDLVEGPWVEKHGPWYYLFYSGNSFWNERYAMGVARARSPLGPFEKKGAPVLSSNQAWMGPGHGAVVDTPGGAEYMLYHSWEAGRVGAPHPRVLLMDRVDWGCDGWPRIHDGSPSRTPRPLPAV
ncbi:MAG: family 43 glycosylhydrolase [Armatimonadetes bacterium]|nr:family 43 glycosylhydrolase [Armatimonadota bacterium]